MWARLTLITKNNIYVVSVPSEGHSSFFLEQRVLQFVSILVFLIKDFKLKILLFIKKKKKRWKITVVNKIKIQ